MQLQLFFAGLRSNTSRISCSPIVRFAMYGSALFLMIALVVLELYLVRHVYTTAGIFSHIARHAHAVSLAPRIAEGPPDIPGYYPAG
jgi:hypothetical protein